MANATAFRVNICVRFVQDALLPVGANRARGQSSFVAVDVGTHGIYHRSSNAFLVSPSLGRSASPDFVRSIARRSWCSSELFSFFLFFCSCVTFQRIPHRHDSIRTVPTRNRPDPDRTRKWRRKEEERWLKHNSGDANTGETASGQGVKSDQGPGKPAVNAVPDVEVSVSSPCLCVRFPPEAPPSDLDRYLTPFMLCVFSSGISAPCAASVHGCRQG